MSPPMEMSNQDALAIVHPEDRERVNAAVQEAILTRKEYEVHYRIPRRIMESLRRYPWPGNVRKLRNVIEHAMIISRGKSLEVRMPAIAPEGRVTSQALEDVERKHILSVLEGTRWRLTGRGGAAEQLGLKRTTLQSRMKKLGIKRPTS